MLLEAWAPRVGWLDKQCSKLAKSRFHHLKASQLDPSCLMGIQSSRGMSCRHPVKAVLEVVVLLLLSELVNLYQPNTTIVFRRQPRLHRRLHALF